MLIAARQLQSRHDGVGAHGDSIVTCPINHRAMALPRPSRYVRARHQTAGDPRMNVLINFVADVLTRMGLLKEDLDYHLLRASMVLIFLLFGYQKWFEYEAHALIPFISNGPFISWLYPVFGIRGATWFLGASEWTFGALLFLGFWDKRLGVLGALGSTVTYVMTVSIIPFMPNGWAASAGGFPAMTVNVAFLMKDVVLLAVSIYLLKQDVARLALRARNTVVASPVSSARQV
jgi:uncharacterized membrane protein YkgB